MKMRTIPILLLLLFVLIFSQLGTPRANANGILELNDSKNEYDLTSNMSVLEDKENRLVLYDLLDPKISERFVQSANSTPNFGFTSSFYWAKLQLRNQSSKDDWLLEIAYPQLDSINLYILDGSNAIILKHAGDDRPFSYREVKNRNHVFKVKIKQGQTLDLFLRFQTQGSMVMPLKLIHPVSYAQKEQSSYLLLGGYYGIIIIMTIYNIFMAFYFRAKAYLYFALYSVSALLLFSSLNGISFQFIWPHEVWWNNRATAFFLQISHIAALLFSRNFLPVRSISPRLSLIYNLFIAAESINIFLLVVNFPLGLQVSVIKYFFFYLLMIIPGIKSLQAGFKPARYYLLGWGLFTVCAMTTTLADIGFLPMNSWTMYSAQIGSTLETLILSWGLANRIQMMRKEKDLAVEQMQESRKLADSDFLTGLFNRRYIMNIFTASMGTFSQTSTAFLIMDVDHFKRINDTYGHDAGDSVLQKIAFVLQQCGRPGDVIGRFGGEEFIILMPDTDLNQALRCAEYLLNSIRSFPFEVGNERISCTVSIGITEWKNGDKDDFNQVLRRADEALYEAKKSGRNRICIADS